MNEENDKKLAINVIPGGSGVTEEEKAERLSYVLNILNDVEEHCKRQLEESGIEYGTVSSLNIKTEIIYNIITGSRGFSYKIKKSDKSKIRFIERANDYISTIDNIKEAKRCAEAGELANSMLNTIRAMNSFLHSDAARGALRRMTGTAGANSQQRRNAYEKQVALELNAEFLLGKPSTYSARAKWIARDLPARLKERLERDQFEHPNGDQPDFGRFSYHTIRRWIGGQKES